MRRTSSGSGDDGSMRRHDGQSRRRTRRGWGSSRRCRSMHVSRGGRTDRARPLRVQRTDQFARKRPSTSCLESVGYGCRGASGRLRKPRPDYKSVFHPRSGPSENVTGRPGMRWDERWYASFFCRTLSRSRRTRFVMSQGTSAVPRRGRGMSAGAPARRAVAADREGRLRRHLQDQGRRPPALAGDGHGELADRRLRRAADRFAEHQGCRGLGREEAHRVGRARTRASRRGATSARAGRTSASRRPSSRRIRGRSSARRRRGRPGTDGPVTADAVYAPMATDTRTWSGGRAS